MGLAISTVLQSGSGRIIKHVVRTLVSICLKTDETYGQTVSENRRKPGEQPMSPRLKSWLLLPALQCHGDAALLVMRATVGLFLVWGVLDNITDAGRMREFEAFLGQFGFPAPAFMAPLSVWAQFIVGLCFIGGLLTRWAGVVCAINFIVAIVMVDAHGGIRAAFPAACLVLIGLYLATHGPGRYSLDHFFKSR
jgi:putative oxidoreductase